LIGTDPRTEVVNVCSRSRRDVVELVYGVWCWYIYRGGVGLLALVGLGNLANLSILSPPTPGPEQIWPIGNSSSLPSSSCKSSSP